MANGDLLGIGSSALLAFQRSLATTGHNIANANTAGYSRQVVDLSARSPQATGYGFIGTGVETDTVRRIYDTFIEGQIRSYSSSTAESSTFHQLAVQVDNVLADPDAGLSSAMQRFFNAVQDVADDPASTAARQVLLSEGQQLSSHYNELAGWFSGMRSQVNNQLQTEIAEVNQLSESIAAINNRIVIARGSVGGQLPNDLLDQRDLLVRNLAEHVSVATLEQENGALNVMVGTGQVLVQGGNASQLALQSVAGDPEQLGIALTSSNGALIPLTRQITGGSIGGVLGFRDRVLEPAENGLGRIAISLGEFFNQQHRGGMDLDGALGNDFFTLAQPEVFPDPGNAGSISVSLGDVANLTDADYRLSYDGAVWSMLRTDTNQPVTMSGTGTGADPFVVDGLAITIGAGAASGDIYHIQPTRNGATDIQVNLADTRQIAAAAPIRSSDALSNTGSGHIGAGTVTDISNAAFQTTPGQLSPPLLVRFTSATSYDIYDNSIPASPVLLEAGIAYDPSTGGAIFPTPGSLDFGYQATLTGAVAATDEFTLEYNAGGIGDNRNALLLNGLSDSKLLNGGREDFSDTYRRLVVDVGTNTRQAELNEAAQQHLLDQVTSTRESVSGVNLDEEAANLVRFQQAYQAAAQVVSTANTLFDSLLNAVRR